MLASTPLVTAPAVAVVVGATAALLAWRERPEPGATPLAVMLAGQVWWAAFFVLELTATAPAAKYLWYDLQWVGVVVIPVAWLVFALEYTGRDEFLTRGVLAALAVVPAVTLLVVATGDSANLLLADRWIESTPRGDFVATDPSGWYYVAAGYTYVLGAIGSVPLVRLAFEDATPFRGQGAALLVGTLVPWASSALYLAGAVPIAGLDPTPIAFAVAGVAYLGALTRFRLLNINPSSVRHARGHVFDRMHAAVVVVDNNGYVVDCNRSATATLGVDPESAVGRHASAVVPSYEAVPTEGTAPGPVTVRGPDGRRSYDVTASRITDVHDRPVGRAITFHDVGEYLRQQQRLEVLNRVLRHNIRTETNLIYGYADLTRQADRRENAISVIQGSANRVHDLSERTRLVTELFEDDADPTAPTPLSELLDDAIDRFRLHHPEASVTTDAPPDDLHVAGVLDVVLDNLLANAVEHDPAPDPTVRVGVSVHREADDHAHVRVTVADEGPGISDYEWAVIERGGETPLEHSSGLGLWLVRWGVDVAGGSVSREETPEGTRITVELPVLDPEPTDADDTPDTRPEPPRSSTGGLSDGRVE